MFELMLMAAAQVQTIRLPPVQPAEPTPPTVERQTQALPSDLLQLPDLVITGLRLAGAQGVDFYVENRGRADASQVRISACAHYDSNEVLEQMGMSDGPGAYCSRPAGGRGLVVGEGRWVRVTCFLSKSQFAPSSGGGGIFGGPSAPTMTKPECVSMDEGRFSKFSASVDPAPDRYVEPKRAVPLALQETCTLDDGCIKELNERNNYASFSPPFDQ